LPGRWRRSRLAANEGDTEERLDQHIGHQVIDGPLVAVAPHTPRGPVQPGEHRQRLLRAQPGEHGSGPVERVAQPHAAAEPGPLGALVGRQWVGGQHSALSCLRKPPRSQPARHRICGQLPINGSA